MEERGAYPASSIQVEVLYEHGSVSTALFTICQPDPTAISIALEKISVSDLIRIDKNTPARLEERRRLLNDHLEAVVGAEDATVATAVEELYVWMTTIYLPQRFPSIFDVRWSDDFARQELWSNMSKQSYSLKPGQTACGTLRALGEMVEEDFFLLLPDHKTDSYTLRAFLSCFPNSFDARGILGKNLRQFHEPVPGYAEKLERSVDRWFRNLPAGKFSTRCNVCPESLSERSNADLVDSGL